MWPVFGAIAEFNFYDGTRITGFGWSEIAGIMEEKALAVVHVGINFKFPAGLSECGADAVGKYGL